jgi:hypothetical protein
MGLGNFAAVTWTSLAMGRKERGCVVSWGSRYSWSDERQLPFSIFHQVMTIWEFQARQ